MSESNQTLIQQFYVSFQASRSELSSRLDHLKSQGPASLDALNELALEIAKLRKELTDATAYLPSYDQRQYETHLKTFEQSLVELRSSSVSKPKFSFKRKQAAQSGSSSPQPAKGVPQSTSVPPPISAASQSNGRILSNLSNEYLTSSSIPSSTSSGDLTISNLDNCVVNLVSTPNGSPGSNQEPKITALHVRDISNSILLFPPNIDGSAMLHNLSRCIIVLGCHQFRMHSSSHVNVYLAISSNPIIEHCSDITFTGYPFSLFNDSDAEKDILTSNKHLSVQDFSHIRPSQSPNWRILPDSERVPEGGWPHSKDVDLRATLSRLLPT
ncbi:unnamed protein product [Somion occarium]|uniref:C-CAP/cofactor C-like domain-containing protein n=1 Tax=Somion occarium TaxID=3059160 RepID=A0ABP1DQ66_9APHY